MLKLLSSKAQGASKSCCVGFIEKLLRITAMAFSTPVLKAGKFYKQIWYVCMYRGSQVEKHVRIKLIY